LRSIAATCLLLRDSSTNTLSYGIDSRINFRRNFFKLCGLSPRKNLADSFSQVSAFHCEISFHLREPTGLDTNGGLIHRPGVNRRATLDAPERIVNPPALSLAALCAGPHELSFLRLCQVEFGYFTKNAILE
jgi:hypothetical protein